jgi:hypothetical protein
MTVAVNVVTSAFAKVLRRDETLPALSTLESGFSHGAS